MVDVKALLLTSSSAFIQAPSAWSKRWTPLHCWNVLLAQGEHVGDHALFALQDLSNKSAVTLRWRRLTCRVGMGMCRVGGVCLEG